MNRIIFFILSLFLYSENPYMPAFEKHCKYYDLNKKIIFYQAVKENSKFCRYAKSHANAYGIMQVQVRTFKHVYKWEYGKKCIFENKTIMELLKIPEYNIWAGCAYMRYLLNKYKQNYIIALSHYNMGEYSKKYNWRYVNEILLNAVNK